MNIVIATGIYPPEIGGPAYYAVGLAEAFKKAGHRVSVSTYGWQKMLPAGLRHAAYAFKLFRVVIGADAVIALDTFSVAVPASLVCRIVRVPLIIRTGGDFLWEQYLERTHDLIPLPRFYETPHRLSLKEKLIFRLTRFALSHAYVAFSTEMQRDMWLAPYDIDPTRVCIIGNAIGAPFRGEEPKAKNYLWHVRPVAVKNGARLHAAFAKAKQKYPDIILEEGTMLQAHLLERMKRCYAVILPSVTEISPNYILDALRFHKPFIMDKYSGLASWLGAYGTLVDPLDEENIVRAISRLAEPSGYAEAKAKAARFSFARTYDDVARDFLRLVSIRS
jgi:glycosyltransferase involved in cell wall biosynthesis